MANRVLISGRLVPEKPASSAQGASMARSVKFTRKRKLNRSSFFAIFGNGKKLLVTLQTEMKDGRIERNWNNRNNNHADEETEKDRY